ncbi:MAG TPA: GNAT family N-acetyltransferase [Gemmatimonadaceae bacterium]
MTDTLTIRRIQAEDLSGAIRLVQSEAASNEWLDDIPEMLEAAVSGDGRELRAVCIREREQVIGVGLFGSIAGTIGTAAIHAILVAPQERGRGFGSQIARFIRDDLQAIGARLIIAELPDDHRVSEYRAILWGIGLKEESRIPDYYSDGISLLQMRLDL